MLISLCTVVSFDHDTTEPDYYLFRFYKKNKTGDGASLKEYSGKNLFQEEY
ncbi:MAG: hypothetical protein HW411_1552, partial [Gammaproteobacteria bacterium]|nr:hypothetical protein [Gammaproteobacteria bacterium]